MRTVVQRVSEAKVTVNGETVGAIENGILTLVGFNASDNTKSLKYIIDKLINLRIFEDDNDKMNLSLSDKKYGLLIVPNFTLYADARGGRRPSFVNAAPSSDAALLFSEFVEMTKDLYDGQVEGGIFGADMKVSLVNDGPVTILLDSDKLF